MRHPILLALLLLTGCTEAELEAAPAAPAAPVARPAAPAPPPAPQLTEAEMEAVLAPARAAAEAAELTPTLPLTLNDPTADGPVYDRIVDVLLAHLRITRVRIGAHTDPRGAEEYNARISQERAEAVARALIERGIACGRIEAVGYGESRPIADAPMSAQRRIELSFERVDQTWWNAERPDACSLGPVRP